MSIHEHTESAPRRDDGAFSADSARGVQPQIHRVVTSEGTHIPKTVPTVVTSREFHVPALPRQDVVISRPSERAEPLPPRVEAATQLHQMITDVARPEDPVAVRFFRTRTQNWVDNAAAAGALVAHSPEAAVTETRDHLVAEHPLTMFGAVVNGTIEDGRPYTIDMLADRLGMTTRHTIASLTTFHDIGAVTSWTRSPGDPLSPQKGYVFDADKILVRDTEPADAGEAEPQSDADGVVVALREQMAEIAQPGDGIPTRMHRSFVLNAATDAAAAGILRPYDPTDKTQSDLPPVETLVKEVYKSLVTGDIVPEQRYHVDDFIRKFKHDEVSVRRGLATLRRAGIASTVESQRVDSVFVQGGTVFNTRNIDVGSALPDESQNSTDPSNNPGEGTGNHASYEPAIQLRDPLTGRLRPQTTAEMDKAPLAESAAAIEIVVAGELALGSRSAISIARDYFLPLEDVQKAMLAVKKR